MVQAIFKKYICPKNQFDRSVSTSILSKIIPYHCPLVLENSSKHHIPFSAYWALLRVFETDINDLFSLIAITKYMFCRIYLKLCFFRINYPLNLGHNKNKFNIIYIILVQKRSKNITKA